MSNMHTRLDAARKSELAQDPAEHPRRAHPVKTADPVLRALSAAEAAFNRYAAHHLRQASQPGEDKHRRIQQAGENADLAQAMREGILAHFAQSHAVPQGWKLVPCEPTDEMYAAAMDEGAYHDDPEKVRAILRSEYQSMLAATPKLATAQAQPERKPLTDESILDSAGLFGEFQYGDALGDKRIGFGRAIERACAEAWGGEAGRRGSYRGFLDNWRHNPIPRRGLLAIAMMLEIAAEPEPVQVYALRSTGMRQAWNEQMVRQLRDAGLLAGKRGPGGGVRLATLASQITLWKVVDAVVDPEDPIDQRDPFARAASHITSGMCYALHEALDSTTLESALMDARKAGIIKPRQTRQPPAPEPAKPKTQVKMPAKPASVFNFGG